MHNEFPYGFIIQGDKMGIFSIILIIIWLSLIFDGVYGIAKGHFFKEQDKVQKHDQNAYRKWVRISGVLLIICSAINITWSIFDAFADDFDWTYVILIVITVAIFIAIVATTYYKIVKSADKKAGIESEIDKILKEKK